MAKIKLCTACGVPRRITKEHVWMPNGTIVERKNPEHRMVFIERDALIDTFAGIERILGVPIDRIIAESQRRSTFDSVDHMLSAAAKAVLRWTGTGPISRDIATLGRLNGMGDIRLVSFRRRQGRDDYIKLSIREPYSLAHFSGNFAGAMEAIDRREIEVTCEEISPDEYELTGRISPHPVELRERLQAKRYVFKPGDIDLAACPECGGPEALSVYAWRLERGVIENRNSGRRMIMIGPGTQETILDELTKELGDAIPQTATEAQRQLVASGFFSSEEITGTEDFRAQFAYRGLGNLREVELDKDHLHFRLENPCLHFMVVGLAQGLYEMAFGVRSEVEWELTPDGDLAVDVRAE
jgi:hypothetical protein